MNKSVTADGQKSINQLIEDNKQLREEIRILNRKLESLQEPQEAQHLPCKGPVPTYVSCKATPLQQNKVPWQGKDHSLSKDQVERYSRQILLQCMGVQGALSQPAGSPLAQCMFNVILACCTAGIHT